MYMKDFFFTWRKYNNKILTLKVYFCVFETKILYFQAHTHTHTHKHIHMNTYKDSLFGVSKELK